MKNIAKNNSNYKVGRIIVVDDEAELMSALCEMLAGQGYETAGFLTGAEALAVLKEREFDLLLTDLMMPGMDGIELIRAGIEIDPNLIGIIMTGHGTVQTAVEAMKTGAFDYILKPFKVNTLLPLLSRAMQVRNLRLENMQLKETVAIHELGKAIAFSSDLNSILNKIADAALQQCSADEVTIMLPTKSGRELYVAVVRGGRTDNLGEHAPIEQGIAGWVARNRESVVFRGEVNDPRMAPIRPRIDIHTAISMPMLSQSKLVGVLNVNITKSHRQFTLGQLKALSILVSIISPILENTALYIQIRKAEEEYRSIFENAREGIFRSLPGERFIAANPALARIFGYDSPEDLVASVTDITRQIYVNPDDAAEFARIMEPQGEVINFECQAYRKNGSRIRISVSAHAVRDEKGVLLYHEGTLEDITERKEAEEWLLRERSMVDRIMRTSPAGITVADRDGRIVFANKRAEEILGLSLDKITGLTYDSPEWLITDFDGNPFPIENLPFAKVISSGSPVYGIRHTINSPEGRRVYLSINGAPIFDEKGNINEVVFTIDDVTEQRRAEEKINETIEKLRRGFDDTIRAMAMIVEQRDPYTAGHQERVANLSVTIAQDLNLSEEQISGIRMAGMIHDIGKMKVPAEILSKPTQLSHLEFDLIKSHAEVGYKILETIAFPYPVAKIAYQHHERINGAGYPQKLKGDDILIEARILAVADVVEAMASHRPYRPGLGIDAALEEIEKNRGVLYDDNVADACLKLFREKGFRIT
ncbi:MAG: PAS domain S-box protein [Syntrophales bacterium]|nr:PAS domain S-box protein [Syntrophales bacterium]MDP3097619.1 PAS domain S-box protein [Syntrophales bacterium]